VEADRFILSVAIAANYKGQGLTNGPEH